MARACCIGLCAVACGTAPDDARPNIVLVTIDTLRADHLSCYGYGRETTPKLSAWIGETTVFESAYAPSPLTDPSLASTLTGLHPMRHGVRHAGRRLGPELPTLAELLKAQGYQTGAFVSRAALIEDGHLGRGFDVANFVGGEHSPAHPAHRRAERWQRRAPSVTDAALAWLRERGDAPFFLWLHYFDPHAYYDPPEPFRERFLEGLEAEKAEGLRAWWGRPADRARMVARYDAEILTVDHFLDALVSELRARGLWDSTLFVLTSDHGESLGEHGYLDHGEWLYQEQVRVPLVFRLPGVVPEGLRVSALVRGFDLGATLLELIGASGSDVERYVEQGDGRSFAPLFEGRTIAPRKIVLESEECPAPEERDRAPGMECDPPGVAGKIRALFDGRYKLIVTPRADGQRVELYDVSVDPSESEDLSEREPGRVSAMRTELEARWSAANDPSQVDEDVSEKLRALGYTR